MRICAYTYICMHTCFCQLVGEKAAGNCYSTPAKGSREVTVTRVPLIHFLPLTSFSQNILSWNQLQWPRYLVNWVRALLWAERKHFLHFFKLRSALCSRSPKLLHAGRWCLWILFLCKTQKSECIKLGRSSLTAIAAIDKNIWVTFPQGGYISPVCLAALIHISLKSFSLK